MLYIVCAYIVICVAGLIFIPTHIPETPSKKKQQEKKEEKMEEKTCGS